MMEEQRGPNICYQILLQGESLSSWKWEMKFFLRGEVRLVWDGKMTYWKRHLYRSIQLICQLVFMKELNVEYQLRVVFEFCAHKRLNFGSGESLFAKESKQQLFSSLRWVFVNQLCGSTLLWKKILEEQGLEIWSIDLFFQTSPPWVVNLTNFSLTWKWCRLVSFECFCSKDTIIDHLKKDLSACGLRQDLESFFTFDTVHSFWQNTLSFNQFKNLKSFFPLGSGVGWLLLNASAVRIPSLIISSQSWGRVAWERSWKVSAPLILLNLFDNTHPFF